MTTVAEALAAIVDKAARRRNRPVKHRDRAQRFYRSFAWRRLRYVVLAENAERNGGIARCELCGTWIEYRDVGKVLSARTRPHPAKIL